MEMQEKLFLSQTCEIIRSLHPDPVQRVSAGPSSVFAPVLPAPRWPFSSPFLVPSRSSPASLVPFVAHLAPLQSSGTVCDLHLQVPPVGIPHGSPRLLDARPNSSSVRCSSRRPAQPVRGRPLRPPCSLPAVLPSLVARVSRQAMLRASSRLPWNSTSLLPLVSQAFFITKDCERLTDGDEVISSFILGARFSV